jgi:hypothetical protein
VIGAFVICPQRQTTERLGEKVNSEKIGPPFSNKIKAITCLQRALEILFAGPLHLTSKKIMPSNLGDVFFGAKTAICFRIFRDNPRQSKAIRGAVFNGLF